jgi:hypothetical protein
VYAAILYIPLAPWGYAITPTYIKNITVTVTFCSIIIIPDTVRALFGGNGCSLIPLPYRYLCRYFLGKMANAASEGSFGVVTATVTSETNRYLLKATVTA